MTSFSLLPIATAFLSSSPSAAAERPASAWGMTSRNMFHAPICWLNAPLDASRTAASRERGANCMRCGAFLGTPTEQLQQISGETGLRLPVLDEDAFNGAPPRRSGGMCTRCKSAAPHDDIGPMALRCSHAAAESDHVILGAQLMRRLARALIAEGGSGV